jgi:hypothetical protein
MKQKYKYNQGGDILGGVSQLAPLLNMAVPGLGTGIGAIAGLGAKYFNDQEMKAKQAEAALNNPANYSNQNAFGYADGGMLSGLAQGAGLVTGAPNQVDGNEMNYKGSPIALNHGETLDTNKDRVISANYFNPVTGKKIVDEDKALKRSRGKAENVLKNGTDSAAANTVKYTQQQEDALFRMQEMIAQMAGDRNRPQDQQQQMPSEMPQQGYKAGGNIMKYEFAGGIPHPPEWYAQHVNDDLTFKPQPIGVPKANPAYKQYNVFNQAPINKYSYTDPAVNAQSYWGNNFDVKAGKSAYNAFATKQNLLNKGVKDYVASPILKDNNIYDQAAHNALFESKLGKELFSDTSPFTNRQSSDGKTLYSFTGQGVKGNPIQYTTEGDTTPKTMPDGTEFNPLSGLYGAASSIAGNMTPEQLNAIGGQDFIAEQRPTLTEEEATQMNGKINPESKSNFWTQSTQGEKIGMLGQGASLLAKGIESFQPLQQQQTRPNTAPISLSQLDPSAILNRNQQSYQSALAQAQGNTSNQNVGYQQALFANKLTADNQALSQFQAQNAGLKESYEQRLAQRQSENNVNANQVDDIMARRRGARENMRMGVYGDVATMGMNVGQLMNTRLGNQATVGMMKGIAPDVYENQIKNMSPELKRYFGITK